MNVFNHRTQCIVGVFEKFLQAAGAYNEQLLLMQVQASYMAGAFEEHGCTSSNRVRHGHNLPACTGSVQFGCSFLEVKKPLLVAKQQSVFCFQSHCFLEVVYLRLICCIISPAQSFNDYFIACFWPQSNSSTKLKQTEVIYTIAFLGNTVKAFS